MDHYGKILRNSLLVFAVTAASVLGGCAKEPAPPAQTTAAQTTEATAEPETTEASTEADGEAVDLTNRYHMLQGTVVKIQVLL